MARRLYCCWNRAVHIVLHLSRNRMFCCGGSKSFWNTFSGLLSLFPVALSFREGELCFRRSHVQFAETDRAIRDEPCGCDWVTKRGCMDPQTHMTQLLTVPIGAHGRISWKHGQFIFHFKIQTGKKKKIVFKRLISKNKFIK